MNTRRWFGLAACALGSAVGVACQVVGGIDLRTLATVSGADATVADAATADVPIPPMADVRTNADAGADVVDTCPHALPPPPPTSDSPGDAGDFYVAVQTIFFHDNPEAGVTLGYDLDGVCSACPGGPFACRAPGTTNVTDCDRDGGRDLGANILLGAVATIFDPAGALDAIIAMGKQNIVLKVTGYNGGSDDTNVALGVLGSPGILIGDPEAGAYQAPKWDGNDLWSIDPTTAEYSILPDDAGYAYQPNVFGPGYVSNRTMVFRDPSGLSLQVGVATLTFSDATLTARVSGDASAGYVLAGQVDGRVSPENILAFAGSLSTILPDTSIGPFCNNVLAFQNIQQTVCSNTDILYDRNNRDSSAPCDALSLALGFIARSAKVGAPVLSSPTMPCEASVGCP